MAIEIKRTPVLHDEAAQIFLKKISSKKSRASSKKVKNSMKIAAKILFSYKSAEE
ncbi:MAG: hypothetical protein IPH66_08735 [Crocinitomicaceae bacterium]|nr:hypothetical protein [Crocinitomicaceae bacterium]